jgi:biotin carboxyl carrier protein
MSIEQLIAANTAAIERLTAVLNQIKLPGVVAEDTVAEDAARAVHDKVEAAATKKKPAKPEPKPEAAPQPEPTPEPEQAPQAPQAQPEPAAQAANADDSEDAGDVVVDYDAIRKLVLFVAGGAAKPSLIALLQRYGVANAKQLPTDMYGQFYKELSAIANGV